MRLAAGLALLASALLVTCVDSNLAEVVEVPDEAGLDSGVLPHDGAGGTGGDGAGGTGGAGGGGGGEASAPRAVPVAVRPVGHKDGSGSEPEASLAALAAGARGVVLWRAFDEVAADGGGVDAGALDELRALARPWDEEGLAVTLVLYPVLGRADRRPAAERGRSFAHHAVQEAGARLVREVALGLGDHLSFLVLGADVDLHLEALDTGQRPQLVSYLEGLTEVWRAATDVPAGIGLTARSLVRGAPEGVSNLAAAGQMVAASDVALDATGRAPWLGELLASPRLEARELVLYDVGHPSAGGGTLDQQRAFHASFFDALDRHRDRVLLVGLSFLDDPDPARCEARALGFSVAPAARLMESVCSLGVRDQPRKPVWPLVMEAFTRFAPR